MGKRRLRRLRIGDAEYLWSGQIGYVGTVPDEQRCVHLRISARRGVTLAATLVSAGPLGPWGAATDSSYPTPGTVRAVLDLALDHGWNPHADDPAFALTATLDGWDVHAPTRRFAQA
ncbi:hypothetical protein GCM10010441_41210 [Kitasatospora paracochleata]|uniref:Uncharacterized protein n=1 Tax=Kitasatospora paracochleata TaxID=58354 RepID=A0ABT1J4S6_9ACTN|nr:hypothetical protein [Kitasatospora paracochleata]MCP2312437.1 hypothetical protein [Kitasatospora paracochleata]